MSQGRHEYNNRNRPFQGGYPPDGSRTVTELSEFPLTHDRRNDNPRDGGTGGHGGGHEMETRDRVD